MAVLCVSGLGVNGCSPGPRVEQASGSSSTLILRFSAPFFCCLSALGVATGGSGGRCLRLPIWSRGVRGGGRVLRVVAPTAASRSFSPALSSDGPAWPATGAPNRLRGTAPSGVRGTADALPGGGLLGAVGAVFCRRGGGRAPTPSLMAPRTGRRAAFVGGASGADGSLRSLRSPRPRARRGFELLATLGSGGGAFSSAAGRRDRRAVLGVVVLELGNVRDPVRRVVDDDWIRDSASPSGALVRRTGVFSSFGRRRFASSCCAMMELVVRSCGANEEKSGHASVTMQSSAALDPEPGPLVVWPGSPRKSVTDLRLDCYVKQHPTSTTGVHLARLQHGQRCCDDPELRLSMGKLGCR